MLKVDRLQAPAPETFNISITGILGLGKRVQYSMCDDRPLPCNFNALPIRGIRLPQGYEGKSIWLPVRHRTSKYYSSYNVSAWDCTCPSGVSKENGNDVENAPGSKLQQSSPPMEVYERLEQAVEPMLLGHKNSGSRAPQGHKAIWHSTFIEGELLTAIQGTNRHGLWYW